MKSALEMLAEQILGGAVSLHQAGNVTEIHVHNGPDRVAELYVEEEAFLDQCRELDAADKIAALTAMGFTAVDLDHQADCPTTIDAGNYCNCGFGTTVWFPPPDVLAGTLTSAQIGAIRAAYTGTPDEHAKFARRYGVSVATIRKVLRYEF